MDIEFSRTVADKLGLVEAILLRTIELKIKDSQTARDGIVWIQISFKELNEELPFLSISTIKRKIQRLKKTGIVLVENCRQNNMKQKNWISIDKDNLKEVIS